MSKHKALLKKIGLYLMISLAMITIIMGISFWGNAKNPTYESVPYTVEEARVYVTDYGTLSYVGLFEFAKNEIPIITVIIASEIIK